jgi:hypothetical protein
MIKEKSPKILDRIIEFFNFWNNPDDEKGEYTSIKTFQLRIYDVSYDFVFKWYITEQELKEVSEFTNIPIKNNSLALGIGEHFLELTFRTTK